jgi:transcriptional regulator with AAA-type ATPase domain
MEQRSYRMVGESTERRADVRFVLGTSADLRAAVKSGQFREDLYYRITVLPVRVPSLEERRDEIVPWARHMLEACHRENVPSGQARLSPEAERLLAGESWPGNLRQLESIIRRAYLLQMVECGGVASEVLVEERHLSGAFAYEGAPAQKGLVELLLRAAMGFVREAQVRRLDLDLADAFRGFVLGSAILQLGRDEAFILLGKETLVRNRNHHKSLRREMEKVDGLLRAIGESKSPFAGILGPDPDEGS